MHFKGVFQGVRFRGKVRRAPRSHFEGFGEDLELWKVHRAGVRFDVVRLRSLEVCFRHRMPRLVRFFLAVEVAVSSPCYHLSRSDAWSPDDPVMKRLPRRDPKAS